MSDNDPRDPKHTRSTRAKSCTACRQAKAKCDLRRKFPSPCSRCMKSRRNCQTDDSFQRVATRTRIEALEAQLEQLNRSRVLEVPSKVSATGSNPELLPGSVHCNSSDGTIPVRDDEPDAGWYVPSSLQSPASFILHDCILPWEDVNELFVYFKQFHLPHCGFLIQIGSLTELAEDSELLLWTIIMIAARHHRKHHVLNDALQTAHSRLRAHKCSEAIRKLPDLQAVLLLCMFPLPVSNQDGDTAGLRLAEAVSCARQMGLDMSENEILFSNRGATSRSQKYTTRALRLTWLKCFELDVQLSLWHGILPALAALRYFRSVNDFSRSPDVPQTVAQNMDVYVRTARYLLLLDDNPSAEAAWNLARSFTLGIATVKESKAATWTLDNELVAETCRVYVLMTSYVHISRQQHASLDEEGTDTSTTYAKVLLLDAKARAINIMQRISALTNEAMSMDQTFHAGTTTLPGHPKHTGRVLFFAACVLLVYLSSESDHTLLARENARNAFQQGLQFFNRAPKAVSRVLAGNTLEVAARAIAQRKVRLQSRVTTRMGASIMHDVRELSRSLRERDADKERDGDESQVGLQAERTNQVAMGDTSVTSRNTGDKSGAMGTEQWMEWCYPGTETLPSSMDLQAYDMEDEMLYDVWQNDFMGHVDLSQWDQTALE